MSCPDGVVAGALWLRREAVGARSQFGAPSTLVASACRCRLLSTAAEVRGTGLAVFSFGLSTELSRLLESSFRFVGAGSSVTCIGMAGCCVDGACPSVVSIHCVGCSYTIGAAGGTTSVRCAIEVAVGGTKSVRCVIEVIAG